MIKLSPRSSRPHSLAMCKIPAGSGFGGRNSRVTIGAKVFPGRKVWRRWFTGPLNLRGQQTRFCCPEHIDRGLKKEKKNTQKGVRLMQWLTRNSGYTSPSVRLYSQDTRSARPSPAAAPAVTWPLIRWRGYWPERLTAGVREGSGCGPGCRFWRRWRERFWTGRGESRLMR